MNKKTFLSLVFLAFATMDVSYAHNQVDVYVGRVIIVPHETGVSPFRDITITVDSTMTIGTSINEQNLRPVDALYSIDTEEGDCVIPLSIVPKGGISVDDISWCGAGSYRLSVVPQENCTLNLTTDFPDGTPQAKESIPLSPVATYHLDIVVEDDEE